MRVKFQVLPTVILIFSVCFLISFSGVYAQSQLKEGLSENNHFQDTQNSQKKVKSAPVQSRKETGLRITRIRDPKVGRHFDAQADQVLVRFKVNQTMDQKNKALSRHKATVVEKKKSAVEKLGYKRVRVPESVSIADFLSELAEDSAIESVEANFLLRSNAEKLEDTMSDTDWALKAINAPEAWKITKGDPSVVIAVVDSGISGDHPALSGALVQGYNFIKDNEDAADEHGHGTQVASIIAARANKKEGMSGVAPDSSLMPLKILDANGEGTVADAADAIVYAADQGSRVISLAFGTYAQSGVLQTAIEYATGKNCLIVAAAGNNGTDEPAYPAAYPQTLAVGAVDQFLKPCFFSNRASYVDVTAPGKGILSASIDGDYQELTGTSAAAAHVAGIAALIMSIEPSLNSEKFQYVIHASADDLQNKGWEPETGNGLANAFKALRQPMVSAADAGIVDAIMLPSHPLPGQLTTIKITLRNHGLKAVQSTSLFLSRDGHQVASASVHELGPKETTEVSLSWSPAVEDAGSEVAMAAELPSIAGELLTHDNIRQIVIQPTDVSHRDLAILNVRATHSPILPGATFNFEVTVANLGNVIEKNVLLKSKGFQELKNIELSLNPGERRTITTDWTFPDDRPGPDELLVAYPFVFSIDTVDGEDTGNNIFLLKLSQTREHDQIVPFHATGDSYDDNQYVHQHIALQAYFYFMDQIAGDEMIKYIGNIPGSFISNTATVLEGTFAEDRAIKDPLYQPFPYLRHFCKGADGSELLEGLVGYDSAYEQALNIWDN